MTSSLAKRIGTLGSRQSLGAAVTHRVATALGQTTYNQIPLSEPYPGVPQVEQESYSPVQTNISTLSNGIRVVSRNTHDPICNVGLFVNAGSRYCSLDTSGIGHFLESTSVEGTPNILPNRFQENLARTGSGLIVQAFRDATLYQCETFTKHADFALESIAELIWNSRIPQYRLKRLHSEYLWRRGDVMKDADSEIPEYMHQAAYQGNTIGLPLYCDHNTIQHMNKDVIEEYIRVFYQPSRMIVVGVGLEHSVLERLAGETFGDIVSDPKYANLDVQKAVYTGGQSRFKYDFDDDSSTHVALLFETENWKSPDLMALCVLNMMMGGGGSFSAGGPGKGMYTRLYREVLGSHHWINHISCSHSIFDDTGMFCFYGSSSPETSGDLTSVMVREALQMLERPPNTQELARAKKSLASNICFEFENRQVVFEDLARQVHVFGNHKTPEMWRDEIMNVKAEDVSRVAAKLLKSKPTVLAMGPDVSRVPNVDEVEDAIKASQ